jgi:hypothetical protein
MIICSQTSCELQCLEDDVVIIYNIKPCLFSPIFLILYLVNLEVKLPILKRSYSALSHIGPSPPDPAELSRYFSARTAVKKDTHL